LTGILRKTQGFPMPGKIKNPFDSSKIQRLCDTEFDFPIGTKISINSFNREDRLWSFFVGLEHQKYIVARLPSKKPNLREQVTVRYLKGSMACGFTSTVTGMIEKPYPLLFLEYPKCIDVLELRNSERVFCFIDVAVFWDGDEGTGKITDISRNGCKISLEPASTKKLSGISLNDEIFCQFRLAELEDDKFTKGYVRHSSLADDRLTLGIELEDTPETLQEAIESYIKSIKEYHEAETDL